MSSFGGASRVGAAPSSNGNGVPLHAAHDVAWLRSPLPTASAPAPQSASGSAVSIGEFFGLLRRRIITFLVCVALCLVAAFGLLSTATKEYDAVSAVKVAPIKGDSDVAGGISTITESRIVTSTAVAARAATTLHFSGSLDDLLGHVSVSSPLDSLLIYVTYTAEGPRAAARGANAFARAYLDYRKSVGEASLTGQANVISAKIASLEQKLKAIPKGAPAGQSSALQSQINGLNASLYAVNTTIVVPGQVVGVAQAPSSPTSPKKIIYIAGGALLALIVGTVAAVVRDRRDDKLHGPADLEHLLSAPVLATVPTRTRSEDTPVVAADESTGAARSGDEVDAYRTVATKLRTPITGKGSNTFLLARGGAAKEEHAPLNLAAMFARQGVQTALVTTDRGLRHVAALFDEEPVPSNVAESLSPVPAVPNLWLLGLGAEHEMDSTITAQRNVIEDALTLVDVALLDGVNLDLPSSVLSFGQLTGSAVVVAIDGRTTHAEVARTIRELAQVGTVPLGGLLYVRRARRGMRRRKKPVGRRSAER